MNIKLFRSAEILLLLSMTFATHSALAHDENQHTKNSAHVSALGRPGVAKEVNRKVDISMSDNMRFSQQKLIINAGDTVRFRIVNAGKVEHEFVMGTAKEIEEHAEMMRQMPSMKHVDASSVRLLPSKSGDIIWKFTSAGTFLFACLLPGHREAGMHGSITVNAKGT